MMTVKSRFLSANRQSKIRRTNLCLCALAATSLLLVACDVELRKTDAQLGLNPQQAAGRHIFDEHCERCHSAYSTRGKKGPICSRTCTRFERAIQGHHARTSHGEIQNSS